MIVPDLTRFLAHSRNEVFRAQASRLANALFFWNCNAHLFRLWARFMLPPFVSHEPLMNFCPKFHRFNSATQTRCDIKHSHHFIINPVFKRIQHLALEFDQRPSAGGFSPRPRAATAERRHSNALVVTTYSGSTRHKNAHQRVGSFSFFIFTFSLKAV